MGEMQLARAVEYGNKSKKFRSTNETEMLSSRLDDWRTNFFENYMRLISDTVFSFLVFFDSGKN